MISPEMLRRYPFFADMDDTSLKAIAMITEEIPLKAGEILFHSGQPSAGFISAGRRRDRDVPGHHGHQRPDF